MVPKGRIASLTRRRTPNRFADPASGGDLALDPIACRARGASAPSETSTTLVTGASAGLGAELARGWPLAGTA